MSIVKIKRVFQSVTADVIFRVVAVLGLLLGAVFSFEAKNLSSCQLKYNDYLVNRTRLLTEVIDEERKIQRIESEARAALFLDPVVSKPSDQHTPEDSKRLETLKKAWLESTRIQLEQQKVSDQVRKDNPVPAPPSEVCKI